MICLGTFINVGGIVFGGFLGLLFGALLKEKLKNSIITAVSVSVIIIGLEGTIEKFITDYGPSGASKSIMLVVSLAFGTFLGEIIDIDRGIQGFGDWLKKITKSKGENTFTEGFLTASVTVCVGAMAVMGSLEDGINHDISILVVKSIIDTVTIMIMTASMGKGCMFSSIPVLVFQGGITLLASFIAPILSDTAISNLSLVGNALIFCVGLSLLWKDKFKVANMLPAIIIAVFWEYLPF